MARYIDAEKFIEWLDVGHLRPPSEICLSELNVKKMIELQPTVNIQEVNHGEWLPDYETFTDYNGFESEPIQTGWVCSVCGRQEPRKEPYCHCGALMSDYENEKKGEDNVQV